MAAPDNDIILSPDPRGRFVEGYLYTGNTPKPGTCLQLQGTAHATGKPYLQVATPGADGANCEQMILLNDYNQSKGVDDAFAAGDWVQCYIPVSGEELRIRFGNAAGTADDVAIGGLVIVDTGTGKYIPTTGSPEQEPFVALEAITDPTADQLFMARRL